MRALTLVADRKLELVELPPPPPPGAGEVQIRVKAVALNHIDVWGWRGMAFAKRKMPLVVGAEAAGEIAAVGPGVTGFKRRRSGRDLRRAHLRHLQGLPRGPRQSLRERRRRHGLPRRRLRPRPRQHAGAAGHSGAGRRRAARRRLRADRVRDRRSTCCSTMRSWSRARRCWCMPAAPASAPPRSRWRRRSAATVITTVGDDEKAEKAKALGADHVINYRTERFEGVVRKLTAKKGVDVVFEHVGADTFNGSLLCLKRGGRLVTCGATSGPSTTLNLMQLFQQQYRIIGSFGASMRNIRESLAKMAAGMLPVIDTEVAARRVRARPGAARKPAGVRQDRRHVLSERASMRAHCNASSRRPRRLKARRRRVGRVDSPSACSSACARRSRPRPGQWPARWCCAGSGRWLPRASRRSRQSGRRISGKIAGRDRSDPGRRHGTISAGSPPNTPTSIGSGTTTRRSRRRPHRARTEHVDRAVHAPARRRQARARSLPPISAIGSCRRWAAAATGSTARCSIGCPTSRASPMPSSKSARALHGHADSDRHRRAECSSRGRCERGVHVGMLVDQHDARGIEVTFFGRALQGQPADRPACPPLRMPDPRHARGAAARRPPFPRAN